MTRLEELNVIKDSINRIINIVYGVYKNGIISRIINDDNDDELSTWYDDSDEVHGNESIRYEIAIFYNDKGETDIDSLSGNTNLKYAQSIVKTLTGIDPVYGSDVLYISDLYNKLLEIKDYSDEELKLYFKMR